MLSRSMHAHDGSETATINHENFSYVQLVSGEHFAVADTRRGDTNHIVVCLSVGRIGLLDRLTFFI